MPRFLTACTVILFSLAGSTVMGQSKRFELFGGYSLQRNFKNAEFVCCRNLSGWNTSLDTRINPWLAVVTDFSGHYGGRLPNTGTQMVFFPPDRLPLFVPRSFMFHSGLAGPEVSLRHGRLKPFARALFGAARVTKDGGHNTGFAWGAGGGLDWKGFEKIRIRLVQADYVRSYVGSAGESCYLSA